jgi:hypothetical protein
MNLDLSSSKIKRFFHYWFGKTPSVMQFGNFVDVEFGSNNDSKGQTLETVEDLFASHISLIAFSLRAEPILKSLTTIVNDPMPSCADPLGLMSTIGWRVNLILHTRKTWEEYQTGLIKSKLIFKWGV